MEEIDSGGPYLGASTSRTLYFYEDWALFP